MIKNFDKNVANNFSKEVVAALQVLAKANNVEISWAGGKFGSDHLNLKLSVKVKNNLSVEEAKIQEFNKWASFFGLENSDYGCVFNYGGRQVKLIGFAPRRTKYPLLVREVNTGKEILITDIAIPTIIAARK